MIWKRRLAVAMIATGLGVGSRPARAEDPAPEKVDAPTAPAEAPKQKEPFFGDRFAMYLETRFGPASIETVHNPLTSGAASNSTSELNYNGNKSGQITVGWTLPRDRGQYLLTYTGIGDGDYELDATGLQQSYIADGAGVQISFLAPWWQVTIRDGQLTSTQAPPHWKSADQNGPNDDANRNGKPDPDELRYPVGDQTTLSTTVPKDLGNKIQTWDIYYRREYGGTKIRARWTAGLRYLTYDGAVATPSWLTGTVGTAGFGYSDGVQHDLIVMQQSTTGWGPLGSGEIQFNFFRKRLTLYGAVQAALILETLDADSGAFTYLTRDPRVVPVSYFPGVGEIHSNVSKSSWNTTFEAGVRVKLLENFHLMVDWNRTGYLDVLLLPNDLSVPANSSQTALGTTARFTSRDFVVSSVNVGLSFQF